MKQKSHINKYQIKEKDTRIKNNQIHKIENHKSKGDKNKDSLSFQHQVESKVTKNYLKDDQYSIDKLDLIFKSQPKEIQQKLLKLLISYNAVMHYNSESDMFEVDLLLPFLNQEQKRQFIKQFLQIRRQKYGKQQIKDYERPQVLDVSESNDQYNYSSGNKSSKNKDNRRFSFNIKQNQNQFYQQSRRRENEMIDQINYEEEEINKEVNKLVLVQGDDLTTTAGFKHIQNYQSSKVKSTLDLKQVQLMINQRLKNAINIINKRKGKEQINKENVVGQKQPVNDDQSKKQESIIYQLSVNQSMNNTQKMNESKNISNSQYIREDVDDDQQLFRNGDFIGDKKEEENQYENNSIHKKYEQILQEAEEYDQYEPLFHKTKTNRIQLFKQTKGGKKITSFQDYTKKYASTKVQHNKNKSGSITNSAKNSNSNKKIPINNQVALQKHYSSSKDKQPKADNILNHKSSSKKIFNSSQHSQERMRSRDHTKSAHSQDSQRQTKKIKKYMNQFFNSHKQHLNRLYTDIRGKISQKITTNSPRRQSPQTIQQQQFQQQKSFDDLYILVQQDDEGYEQQQSSQQLSNGQLINNSDFKQQIMKQYQKEILVSNKNLSSEDLVRYFKYLLSNAKKLYSKYLKNNKN